MDPDRYAVGPGTESPVAGEWHARLVEQRAARAGPGLGAALRRAGAQGETGIDDVGGQVGQRPFLALTQHLGPDPSNVRGAVIDGRESLALEKVRRVDGVTAGAQLLGECEHAPGPPLHVVEQHDFGRPHSPTARDGGDAVTARAWADARRVRTPHARRIAEVLDDRQ